jgi:mycofactocin system glycosyltransferase
MRYRTDSTWLRTGEGRRIVLAGSPLRLFRLSEAGGRIADRLGQGDDVERSTLTNRLVGAGALHPAPRRGPSQWTLADVTIVTPQLDGTASKDGRITVDDGSTPPIVGATTRLATNSGPAGARNAGRQLVDTELIAFVDADVDLDGRDGDGVSWLDTLLPHFDDPSVGLVAPRVLGDRRTSLDLGDESARIRAGTRVSYVPAAAILVRAAAFDDIGGFDQALRFGEDVDFVWRLDAAGWSCRYEPASSVWHAPRSSWAERLRQQVGYGSSAAPLSLRHPTALAPYRSTAWNAAAWVIGAFGHPLIGASLAIGGAATAVRRLPGVPAPTALRLAMQTQVASGRQLATAIRRVWWPILAVLVLLSPRARRVALAAALVDPGAVPTDLAYGWGVWRGVRKTRSWKPIVPTLTGRFSASEPARPTRSERSGGPGESPAPAAR